MLSKFSKWQLGFVHYIAKFTILKFTISRFECTTYVVDVHMHKAKWHCNINSSTKPCFGMPSTKAHLIL